VLLGALLVLGAAVFISKAALPAPMKMSDDELFKLVNGSTFTFIGTIKDLGSNVSGIEAKDSLIVQVESVEPSDQPALKKLGDLKGSRLTVAVNPISGIGRQKNISAVFFADPLVYEKNIGVTATAVPIPDSKEDFVRRLQAAAGRKSDVPLRTEIRNAELIVTGEVIAVRALARNKVLDLGSIHNGWELFSEHRPRWKEAIIKVTQRIDKPEPKPEFVSIVFPATHDCFFGPSPKFQVKDSGIWLLQRNQLDQQETKVLLLGTEKFNGNDVQSYTALHPADFQDISVLKKIQQIIATR
jgi:hypothetical protein